MLTKVVVYSKQIPVTKVEELRYANIEYTSAFTRAPDIAK